jgi:LmbE family N-acetylglucosaminyl deacetylase
MRILKSQRFGVGYAWVASGLLMITTIVWSLLAAHVQLGNADQLVDSYMTSDPSTFHNAIFPGAHTFLFKWPLFAAVQFFGATQLAFMVATILVTLATVGALVFVLFKIDRRPLLFGTLCLVLASTLLLVPIQPYAGALLPVNMAMLTTRNLEYVLYTLTLILLIRGNKHIKSWHFWSAVGVLTLLGASDKLFLVISLGGSTFGLLAYALARRPTQVQLVARWLLAGIIATVAATLLLFVIDGRLTHLADAASVAPYSSAHDFKDFAKAIVYSIIGVVTNLGANPAFDTTTLKDMPVHALGNLLSFGGLAFLLNAAALAVGVWAALVVTLRTFKRTHAVVDTPAMLTVMLVWSTLAALAAFIFSVHYYPVDARYITIVVFALFVAGATWLRTVQISPRNIYIAGGIVAGATWLAVPAVFMAHHADTQAMATVNNRNELVAQALQHHPVSTLVGDYWRVVPTKLQAQNKVNILPYSSCNTPQSALTSSRWQVDLSTNSFAYLLTLDGRALAGYTNCTLDQTINSYGKPNSSTLIAGTFTNPAELLLFYDRGAHKSAPTSNGTPTNATVLPIQAEQLPYLTCQAPTDMNIVAHQDDDLLFMNPDILKSIRAGHCIRTIYMTAGDAGADSYYWVSREHGAEAAYSKMIGSDAVWIERIVQLGDHQYVTVASPKGNSQISLIFMHMPDGSPSGEGFLASHDESLNKLDTGKISVIKSVDQQSTYTAAQLTNALVRLMRLYQPADIRTQSNYGGMRFTDHSDHMAAGRFAKKARDNYQQEQFGGLITIPLTFYMGYPIHELPDNVSGQELTDKIAIFLTYAAFDNGTCHTEQQCNTKAVYGEYLRRQYTKGF